MNRITKTSFSVVQLVFILPFIALANCLYNPFVFFFFSVLFFIVINMIHSGHDETCLYVVSAILLLNYAHMIVSVINELCDYLHIRAFKIVPKNQD